MSAKRARSRVVVRARSFLDARAEVLPGERKFLDYAFPPTHVALEVVTNTGGAQFATAGPALSVAERAPSRLARAGCRAVRTARFWRGIVPFTHPRTGGAHDSHHRTAGIAGRTLRRGGRVALCGAINVNWLTHARACVLFS